MGVLRRTAIRGTANDWPVMQVWTTEPAGVQFYTGNFLDGTTTGKSGKVYQKRYDLLPSRLSTIYSPKPFQFPTLRRFARAAYKSTTIYRF